MAAQKQDDQLQRTFSSYVRIRVVVLKIYLGWWTIGRSGERGSGISVLPAWYDDDDDYYPRIFLILLPHPVIFSTLKQISVMYQVFSFPLFVIVQSSLKFLVIEFAMRNVFSLGSAGGLFSLLQARYAYIFFTFFIHPFIVEGGLKKAKKKLQKLPRRNKPLYL